MARITIHGIDIAYEIIGSGKQCAVITPGGRYSKDTPGVRELAEQLSAHDMRVLVWDRPNCGESAISFDAPSESIQNADILAALLQKLAFAPAFLIGGSGGARDSLITAIRHPQVVSRLFLLWITGGAMGIAILPAFYCAPYAVLAMAGGMEAVAADTGWSEQISRNSQNKARLLAWEPMDFFHKMQQWSEACVPKAGAPMPGVTPEELAAISCPTMILRSGVSDPHHTRETTEALAAIIPQAVLAEPPWGDTEWVERLSATNGGPGLFAGWPKMAPQIISFLSQG